MEEAVGKQAADSWDTMELELKVGIVKELISIQTKLLSLSFAWSVVVSSQIRPNTTQLILS